jgi:tocopherol cyclase
MHHPPGRRRPYFEGWYFKLIDPSEQHRYAIIPGVFYGEEPEQDHAFVQLLDGMTARVTFQHYPIEQFWASDRSFELRVGPNHFQADRLRVDIPNGERSVVGELHFENLTPWPVTLMSPGIMGWYAYVPFMQCNHGIVSLDHDIQGSLVIDGQPIDFSGGRGYSEKDWGTSFPEAWIWTQSNHFQAANTCLTASIAIIPWVASAFPGFIIGLWHAGKLHRFTTYTGARVESLVPGDTHVDWVVRNRSHRLALRVQRSKSFDVYAPTREDMSGRVAETIDARIALQFSALDNGKERLILEDTGRNAGLEVAGDIHRLLSLWNKTGKMEE